MKLIQTIVNLILDPLHRLMKWLMTRTGGIAIDSDEDMINPDNFNRFFDENIRRRGVTAT